MTLTDISCKFVAGGGGVHFVMYVLLTVLSWPLSVRSLDHPQSTRSALEATSTEYSTAQSTYLRLSKDERIRPTGHRPVAALHQDAPDHMTLL